MSDNLNWFAERIRPFLEKGFDLEACSYQLRNEDNTPGEWIAKVHVWEHRYTHSTVLPLMERKRKTYPRRVDANRTANLMGLGWLERNA